VRANGFRPIGVDSAYAAFPSVCRVGNGLRLVWRQGTDHVDARDGQIHTATSLDDGRTWTPANVALTDTADLRDPCIATAGGTTWLTYFKGTSTLPAAGCFLRASTDDGLTWGSETRIDNQPYAAISSPIVQAGNRILAAYYGKNAGDTRDSCWLATSTDGTTWTRRVVANGPADRRDYQEPWLIASGAEVWMFLRYGHYAAIGACVSTDGGVTWSTPTPLFADTTARPAAVWLSTGAMAVVARRISDKQPVVRTRRAGAATTDWQRPRRAMPQPRSGPIGMLYAHPLEVDGGVVCAVGIESNKSTARIHVGWLAGKDRRATPPYAPASQVVRTP
jgi:BNR repeat protein